MKCLTCGADNDPANKFCDQCGSRLQAPAAESAAAPAAAPACPNCGAAVVPGEAFCDECGTALTSAAPLEATPVVNSDAPTIFAPPANMPLGGPVCTVCGRQNAPGDRFCDECGATLPSETAAPEAPAPVAVEEAVPVVVETPAAEAVPAAEAAPVVAEEPAAEAPSPIEAAPEAPAAAEEAPVVSVTDETLFAPISAEAPAIDAQVQYDTQRATLEAEIARQQTIIAQLEPVQTALGAATPAGVGQSLADARDALARTQSELDSLAPPAPAVDPAEIARLEAEIARQQTIIAQLEPVQNALGAATPAGVAQSISEARDALAQAQADLAALNGSAPVAPVASAAPPAPEAPAAAPDPVVISADGSEAISPNAPTIFAGPIDMPPPPVETAPPPPPPLAARLVLEEGGATLAFPADKSEIVVGREDPISGIHPEIDMTPYGGESGGVSRQHARITRSNGQWVISDLNSTNYTRVDGIKLDPGVPTPLKNGAKVQFGRVSATFHE